MINSIFLTLFGILIFFLNFFSNGGLLIFIHVKYIPLSLFMASFAIFCGIAGIIYQIKTFRLNSIRLSKTILLVVLFLAGLFLNYLLFLLGVAVLFIKFQDDDFEKLIGKDFWRYFLILAFILSIVFIPTPGISVFTASQRYLYNFEVPIESSKKIGESFGRDTGNYDIGDWVASLNFEPNLNFYAGKEVNLTGFVFKPLILPHDYFLVSRFVIRCCAADATPVGIIVKLADWKLTYPENTWIRVTGNFGIENFNNQENLVVVPKKVAVIEKPANIYIY